MMPGIKYYGKRIFHLILAADRAVFAISVQCFHIILGDNLLNYYISSDFGKFVSIDPLTFSLSFKL